jgi:hypothetical protein
MERITDSPRGPFCKLTDILRYLEGKSPQIRLPDEEAAEKIKEMSSNTQRGSELCDSLASL